MASISTPEFKVILCGEWGVGKTSIFRRFSTGTFVDTSGMSSRESRQSTLGMDHYSKKFFYGGVSEPGLVTAPRKDIKIQLWDTGGLERVASITSSYYKFADAAILVYALDCLHSFHCLSQHLLEILSMAEGARLYLVGNKCDQRPHEVTDQDIEVFLEQFPRFSGVFKISCKTNEGIDDLFNTISAQLATSNLKSQITDAIRLHHQVAAGSAPDQDSSLNDSICCGAK